jgi:hypothetical protein
MNEEGRDAPLPARYLGGAQETRLFHVVRLRYDAGPKI